MPIVHHVQRINANVVDAFDLSQAYRLRLRWDPFVREQHLNGAERPGPKVRTHTVSRHRLSMDTVYLTYRRPELVGMKMQKGPWFFRTFSGSWRFVAVNDSECDVTFRYQFTCRPKLLAPIAERIGTWYLGRDIKRRLGAFGEAIDAGLHNELTDADRGSTDEHIDESGEIDHH